MTSLGVLLRGLLRWGYGWAGNMEQRSRGMVYVVGGSSKSRGGKGGVRIIADTLVSHRFHVHAVKVPVNPVAWNKWTEPYERTNVRNSLTTVPHHRCIASEDLGERAIHGDQGSDPIAMSSGKRCCPDDHPKLGLYGLQVVLLPQLQRYTICKSSTSRTVWLRREKQQESIWAAIRLSTSTPPRLVIAPTPSPPFLPLSYWNTEITLTICSSGVAFKSTRQKMI